ncbi:electron transfer flavoprotein subunit beta/FixA family protein [Geomonas nitrogeniifigens]|uniref:Electron transfer flavoprotein subunit beta n=1 Tax=Geomonas diazotrophica TaxID=2843197 RepID=A0ABX8JED9_9BACT|nr:electron transfer flavoprotein subunit beta/FixA family protein [Geomonas nitrogeniifigens]QWV96133.1 electron transfer flavoprotein subunit beta/FixA family protein [Geomonas nitrogeniifigens]QXE85200.1 electron transfer flavoprotein subunit beta/FixA family protein [Geomonas nitrogeniifigens]
MKILVCIKQVPDMESRFRPNGEKTWYDESDLAFRMNEYDEYAVEQAVQLKEQLGGEPEITVLSIGPERTVEAIKKALAMGGDRAVHIRDDRYYQKDPWQIASMIASYAKGEGFDLIFTGMQSQDRGSAQVGVIVAELLGVSCATTLVGFSYDCGTITVKRELEGGIKGVAKLKLPALVTCQLGLNTPRYPTLPNIMKAKKKEIASLTAAELTGEAELTATAAIYPPAKKGGGLVLEGEIGAQVDRLMGILKEKTAVLR